ncbi:OR2A protein, partial [Acromyrmex charruanus]
MVYWNKDAIYALSSYKILAWLVGVWPIDDNIFCSKIRYLFVIISEILLMTTLLMDVYLACENSSEDPIDTYVVASSAMLGIIKLTMLQIQRSTLSINLCSAIQDWCNIKDANSREIMIQYARTARIISLSLFYCGFVSLTFYLLRLLPFINATANGRTFVLPMTCLFESVSNLQYVLITFYQVIQLFVTYAGNCCTEGIFVGITMHLCGQLKLLMSDFHQIDHKYKHKGGSIIKEFVVRHRKLLKLTETVEDSYSIIILTQIFTSAILICITGFGLIVSWHIHDIVMTVKSIVIMIVMLMQCFLYSYAGDNLRDQSEALSFALYDSNWCDFSPNDIRDLAFIMIKTNIPIRLTAGKFFYVTRATFTDILKTAISYLSALRVMIDKQETNIIGISYSYYLVPMTNIRWKDDVSYAMTLFKLLTWPIGVWPLQVYNIYSLLRCIFATCCVSLMVILPSIELYTDCNNAEQNVDSLMLLCCGILGILKTVWFRIHARNLTNNYSSALNDYLMIKNAKHRAIMRKHASTGRILCCFLMCFSYFSCLLYTIIPFLSNANNKINVTSETMLQYTVPSRCALEYFNAPTSFQFILALKDNDTAMAIKSIMVQSAFLSQLTLYSFIGDYLKSQMEEVGLCVYQNIWYDFPTKLTRNLIFVIMRSESPVTLRAGHFIVTMMIVYIGVDINFHNNVTLVMVIDHLMLASCGTLTIIKIALIRLHRDNLLKNLVNASNDWTYITKQDHRQVMFRYTNLGRFVFFFQMGSTYFVIMPLIVESLLSFAMMPSQNVTLIAKSEKEMQAMQLPQEMICPFDTQIVCFSMCILQSIQLISTCTGNVGSDVFLFGVFMHLCGQLEVLSRELQQFHERKKNGCWKRSKMVTLIERHCLLLNLAKDIVGVLNIILIAQLILHALFICLIGLQFILSLVNSDFVLIMRSISSINILMIQLFIYSYMGETLSSKTQAISHAIYLSKWYNLPTNILRDVCFIIARANVPVRIKSTIVILPSMEFHMGCTNTEQNIDSLMLACCGLLGVFKIICFRIYAKNLTDNYSSARNDYLTIKNAEYRAIMRKHAFMGRILSCFMVCFAYISVVIYSLIPLLGEDLVDDQDVQINRTNEDIVLDYPMPSRCALEYLHAPRSMYEFICIFEFIVLILTSTCNHGNDSLFLNITLHMCGQVKILKADFINFVVSSPQVYDRFNDLIRRHNYLMELAKELTESISVVLLTQLFISSILLCIMGFQFILALKAHNVVVIGKSALVLCTSLMHYGYYVDLMASERWKNDVAYAMTPFKLLTWPIGVWPLQVYNIYSLIRCVLVTCCMSIIVILPSMELHMGCTNTEQNIDGLMLACCGILGVFKTICFRIYAKNLTDNYSSARNDYLTIKNTEYRAIMRKHAFMGRILSCFMVCFSYISVTIYSLIPLLGEDLVDDQDVQINRTNEDIVLDYPMPSRCALEYLHVPRSMYEFICIFEFIVLVLTCTCNHGNDSLFLNITLHMCGQVKILKANFVNFVVSSPQVYDRFNDLIRRHNYLIELAKELTESISIVLLTQLFISSILLCIMGFQFILALKTHNVVVMGKSAMVLCTFLTQLSIYSFIGDHLKSQMEEVGFFIYQSNWYDLPTKLARNLIFIIMRTRSPAKLLAGNFIVNIYANTRYMAVTKENDSHDNPMERNDISTGNGIIISFHHSSSCLWNSLEIMAAVADWVSAKNDEKSYKIMKKYAFKSRLCTLLMLYSAFICGSLYLLSVLVMNLIEIFLQDQMMNVSNGNVNATDRLFIIPCGEFGNKINGLQYSMVIGFQTVQLLMICIMQSIGDSFYINVTLHLTGQLKVLKKKFKNFASKPDTQINHRKRFISLINRHCELTELHQNLEDTFNLIILFQLVIVTLLLALLGLRIIFCLKHHYYVELMKSIFVLNYMLMESLLYCYGGDFIQKGSEDIFHAMFKASWFTFPATMMKDLNFAMMRLVSAEGLDAYRRSNLLRGKSKPSTRTISGHAGLQFFFLRSKPTNTLPNMKTNWNSDIDYGFSTIKSMMWILGLWPLQQNNVVYTIQWFIIFIAGSLTMINVLIEPFKSCDAVRDGLDILRLIESCMHAWSNIVFPRIYMKKIAINLNSAIDDWSSSSMKKESRMVMMGYARAGRLIALTHLIAGATAGALWFISVFLSNKQEAAIIDNDTVATWNFVIPSTCLYKGVSYSTYKILFIMQVIQGSLILISECACDSFFFGITMHLCGQLELLGIQFTKINKIHYDKKRHRNVLGPLVKRHCHLIALTRNIEDAFNINILLRLLIISVVIASSGVGILLSIKQQDYKEMIKMFICIQFYMVQTFLYTYAGDTLKNRSESIVYAIYSITWDEMSPVMVKDLIFIMMRMKTPLRIMHLSLTAIMSSNDDIAYAMTLVKHLTVPIGAWPLQEYNKFALLRHILSSFGLIHSVVVIVQYLELYYNCTSATANLDALTVFSCGILALTKIIWFRIYADNLICNYSSAMNDYVTIDTEEKRIIMRNHAFWGRIICIITLLISYVDSVIFIVGHAQLSSEEAKINITILGHQAGYAIPSTCNDILLLGIILHICGQMELLKIEFTNYNGENKDMKEFEALTSRHCYLMEHAELLIDVISFVLFVQLLISCLIICLVGFQLILALKLHDAVIITKTTSVLSALLLQLFSYSFVGDYLKRQMEDIAHSIYSCNWYYFPLKLMRNVLFVIMRSQQPVQLLAGRFVVVTIETYMSILKNSFSYLSVLRTGMMIMLFLEIIFGSSDVYVKLDALMLMFCNVLSVLKLLSFRIYANNMIRNFTSAINDYLAIDNKKKHAIMRQHAFIGRMISCSILFFAYLASTIFCLVPIIVGDGENIQVNVSIKNQASDLPVPLTWSLGSYHLSANLFFAISIVQYFLLVLNSNCNCGSDSLFLAITTHVCGQMEILKMEFVNYGLESKNIFEDFSKLVSRHHYLMELAELLVEVISFVLLVQMLFSCLIICLIGFQFILALKSHDVVMIIKTITVMGALLLQLFFYSFVGDYLKCQMEDIAQSIYSCNWYCFPLKLMRNVLFVIMRSQQPVQLLAGRFFVVTIETYMAILKSSLSYLSVLRVMVDS